MGLTRRGKCARGCPDGVKGLKCPCPKSWAYYVEFYVLDDGDDELPLLKYKLLKDRIDISPNQMSLKYY